MTANASIITAERPGALRIPNAAFRFRPPDQPTNTSFFARLFGGSGSKPPVTNAPPAAPLAGAGATNALAASGSETPLTGNETPDELQRRVAQMRANGEDIPPEIMTKLRGYIQSGVLQRPTRGGPAPGAVTLADVAAVLADRNRLPHSLCFARQPAVRQSGSAGRSHPDRHQRRFQYGNHQRFE